MARYQFFSIPASNRQQYTFIDMASPSFLTEKAELLAQGFEVGKSDASYGLAVFMQEMARKLFGRKGHH